ncbi:hypothetical protein [Shewanella sp. UCD-KL12]|uniref:hypothetical protein n=1 Tax=Shewanella sp. UCD-KL12 TaxID=1917163 RepID=UPI00097025EE|nr:hypothetical protein [Shewanella sp. UCD-KL12]
MINDTRALCRDACASVGIPEHFLSLELIDSQFFWGGIAGRCLFDCRVSSMDTTPEEVIIDFVCRFFSIHTALPDEYQSILSYLEVQERYGLEAVVNPFTLNHSRSTAKYIDHFPYNVSA